MLPGPVFRFEMMITARRPRSYALRAGYAFILLLILAQNYYAWQVVNGGQLSNQQVAQFALTTFYSFAVFQLIAVLVLAPALTAGVIADERQRKTLHYLLASRLTGGEIVLGKLAVRLVHLAVCVTVGLPVMSLLALLGGIEPALLLLAFGGTATTAFFLASASILISTASRRVRDAVFAAYALELLWLVVPLIPWWLTGLLSGPAAPLVLGFCEAVGATGPVALFQSTFAVLTTGVGSLADAPLRMILSQAALGVFLSALAAWRLRPAFRGLEAGPRRPWSRRPPAVGRRRLLPRPPCGDDPVRWKEIWTEGRGGLARLLGRLAGLAIAGLVLYGAGSTLLDPAPWGSPTVQLNDYLAVVSALLVLVVALVAVAHGAGAITSEREGDTWISLTCTDLTGAEILRGKLLGALWRARGTAVLMLTLWGLGVLTLALPWQGAVAGLVVLAAVAYFSANLGLCLSLILPSTHRAQVLGVAILTLLNAGGQGLISSLSMLRPTNYQPAPAFFPFCMPAMIYRALHHRGPIAWFLQVSDYRGASSYGFRYSHVLDTPGWHLAIVVLSVAGFVGGGYLLGRLALGRFEVVAGRPRRPTAAGPPRPTPLERAADPA